MPFWIKCISILLGGVLRGGGVIDARVSSEKIDLGSFGYMMSLYYDIGERCIRLVSPSVGNVIHTIACGDARDIS
jgi:hypothetical protein